MFNVQRLTTVITEDGKVICVHNLTTNSTENGEFTDYTKINDREYWSQQVRYLYAF